MEEHRAEAVGVAHQPLCVVDIELEPDAPISLGRSPWRNRRVSYIAKGRISGERLRGIVAPGGGDWSELGQNEQGDALTFVDVRSIWRTDDGAQIYVSYTGRLTIPADVLSEFRDPARVAALSPARYYFRVLMSFETSDARYHWLNGIVAVGLGRRTTSGVRYDVFELT